jgi:hypothetical protein
MPNNQPAETGIHGEGRVAACGPYWDMKLAGIGLVIGGAFDLLSASAAALLPMETVWGGRERHWPLDFFEITSRESQIGFLSCLGVLTFVGGIGIFVRRAYGWWAAVACVVVSGVPPSGTTFAAWPFETTLSLLLWPVGALWFLLRIPSYRPLLGWLPFERASYASAKSYSSLGAAAMLVGLSGMLVGVARFFLTGHGSLAPDTYRGVRDATVIFWCAVGVGILYFIIGRRRSGSDTRAV